MEARRSRELESDREPESDIDRKGTPETDNVNRYITKSEAGVGGSEWISADVGAALGVRIGWTIASAVGVGWR